MKFVFKSILIAAPSLVLVGCLGGGGGGGSDSSQPVSLSGVAIDGYLGQATVCLDLNRNSVCDPNEPNAITQADGTYTITGITQQQIDTAPVVVQAIAGTTTDTDLNDSVIPKSYNLVSPAGQGQVISPLTTMVMNKILDGYDLDDANAFIANEIFADTNDELSNLIMSDFIRLKDNQALSDSADIAHIGAQIIARVIAELQLRLVDLDLDESTVASLAKDIVFMQRRELFREIAIIKEEPIESRLPKIQEISDSLSEQFINLIEVNKDRLVIRSNLKKIDISDFVDEYSNGNGFYQIEWKSNFDSHQYAVIKQSFFPEDSFNLVGDVKRIECTLNEDDLSQCLSVPVTEYVNAGYGYEIENNVLKINVDGADRPLYQVLRINSYDLSNLELRLEALDPSGNVFHQQDRDKSVKFNEGAERIDYIWYSFKGPELNDENVSFDKICVNPDAGWYKCLDTRDNENKYLLIEDETTVADHKAKLYKDDNKSELNNGYSYWFSGDLKTIFYCKTEEDDAQNCLRDGSIYKINSFFTEGENFIAYLDINPFLKNGRYVAQIFVEHGGSLHWFERDWFLVDFIEPRHLFNQQAIDDLIDEFDNDE